MPISRRKFLTSGVGALALGALPSPISALSSQPTDNRLHVGLIGLGRQGRALLRSALALQATQNIAVCGLVDVSPTALERASADLPLWRDYRALLAMPALDAVVIATPDASHAQITWEALQAGKHVYLEPPLALNLEEAKLIRRAAESAKGVLQIGHVEPHAVAREAVTSGQLGHVRRVDASLNLLEAPRDWERARELSAGRAGRMLARVVGIVNQIMGTGCPLSAVAHGVPATSSENPEAFHAVLVYADDLILNFALSAGVRAPNVLTVRGTRGALDVPLTDDPEFEAFAALAGWFDCIRSGQLPRASFEAGYQQMVAVQMAMNAYWTGQRQYVGTI